MDGGGAADANAMPVSFLIPRVARLSLAPVVVAHVVYGVITQFIGGACDISYGDTEL